MEPMQLAARLAIEQNMQHITAFSARPDAPTLPIRDRRRALDGVVRRLVPARSPRAGRRSPVRAAAATTACS